MEAYNQKSIIYLDRNNTPDVWGDIRDTIAKNHKGLPKDYCTVVLLPTGGVGQNTLLEEEPDLSAFDLRVLQTYFQQEGARLSQLVE